jgi:uncharacterized membrane protein (DUF2068 family)
LAGAALSRQLLEEDDMALELWVDRIGAIDAAGNLNLACLRDVPRAVAQLIAACALLDAAAVAVAGAAWPWVAACIVAYVLCRLFQKFIPGT